MRVVDDLQRIGKGMSFRNGTGPQLGWLKNRNSRFRIDPLATRAHNLKQVAGRRTPIIGEKNLNRRGGCGILRRPSTRSVLPQSLLGTYNRGTFY